MRAFYQVCLAFIEPGTAQPFSSALFTKCNRQMIFIPKCSQIILNRNKKYSKNLTQNWLTHVAISPPAHIIVNSTVRTTESLYANCPRKNPVLLFLL